MKCENVPRKYPYDENTAVKKSFRRVAHSGQKRIVCDVPQLYTEAKKNKGLIIPLKENLKGSKGNWKSERTVKNIRMDFTNPEMSGRKVLKPPKIQRRIKETHWAISKRELFLGIFKTL
jgi:hypothetical protein